MPYDAKNKADVKKVQDKLKKTYKNVSDTAARQAIHVLNSVLEGDGDEGRAWASVYSVMNDRLTKKAGLQQDALGNVYYDVSVAGFDLQFRAVSSGGDLENVVIGMGRDGEAGQITLSALEFAKLAQDLQEAIAHITRAKSANLRSSADGRAALIRLASVLPKGSEERRAILASLKKAP